MDQYAAEWHEWHDARLAELATPFGWLSVTGLQWLTPGQPAAWPDTPGTFVLDGDWVHFDLAPATTTGPAKDALELLSHPTPTAEVRLESSFRLSARVASGESLNWIVAENQLFELLNRDGNYGIRRRDAKSPLLARFVDLPVFDLDPAWIVPAEFVPYDEPLDARIATATAGLGIDAQFSGEVHFELDGQALRLQTQGCPFSGLSVTFYDRTNGDSTAAWRRLAVGTPDAHNRVFLDFNRAVNYPMAFTPYATCPAPVAGNDIPVAVTAGELAPVQTLTEDGVNLPLLLVDSGGDANLVPYAEDWQDSGVDVTIVDYHSGQPLPALAGYEALVVTGFDGERFAQAAAGDPRAGAGSADLVELIGDALGARLPVVAIGTAAPQLVVAVGEVLGDEVPGLTAAEVPVSASSIAVSDDVLQSKEFAELVRGAGDDAVGLIKVDELLDEQPDETRRQAYSRAWHDLVERFAQLLHRRYGVSRR